MKKLTAGILTAALVLSVGVTSALAATPSQRKHFVDADGDGICDNRNASYGYIDANDDGICDNRGANSEQEKTAVQAGCGKAKQGKQFIDNDGDGICDNKTSRNGRNDSAGCRGYRRGRNQ